MHTESFLQRDWQNADADASSQQANRDGRVQDLAAQEAQVEVLRARLASARAQDGNRQAALDYARVQLGYTRIVAPVGRRRHRPAAAAGGLRRGRRPADHGGAAAAVWVVANYREVAAHPHAAGAAGPDPGRRAAGRRAAWHVDSLEPASQAERSALPPDRAAGNFTKIVQRVPVKIALDPRPDLDRQPAARPVGGNLDRHRGHGGP